MAENKETVLIDVQLDTNALVEQTTAAVKQLSDLQKEQYALNKAIKDGGELTAKQKERYANIGKEIETLKTRVKSNTDLLKQNAKQMQEGNGSLNEMRLQLKQAQAAYAALSKTERESEVGKQAQENIKALHDQVLKLEGSIGQMQRNVGNYEEAMKAADKATGGFGAKMKALWANPWLAVIGAVVAVVKKLVDAFKSSEDRMRELKTAFAPLKGALDVIQQGFDALAKVLSKVVVGAIEGVVKSVRWLAGVLDKLGEAFGKDWGLSKRLEEAQQTTAAIAAAEQALADKKREWVKQEAENERIVSDLRAKVAEKDKYTTEERMAYLKQAMDIEKANAAKRVEIAKDELKLLQDQAKNTENNAEMNDALAEAEANVTRQATAYNRVIREMNGQMAEMINKQNAATKAEEKAEETTAENAVTYEEIMKKRKEIRSKYGMITDAEQQAEELELLRQLYESEEYNHENALLSEEEYQQAKQAIVQRYADERTKVAEEAAKKEAEIQRQLAEDERKAQEQRRQNIADTANAFGMLASSLSSLSDMYAEDAANSEEAARKQKAFAVGSIIASQAQSIANGAVAISTGIASAAATPFPANIAAIISVVAAITGVITSVASSIAQAKKLVESTDAGNYAGGGEVPGRSYSGDRLTAHVNSGEYILPKVTTDNLIDAINSGNIGGGIDYQAMAQAMTVAVAAQPAPVMDYTEFRQFQQKVSTYNELARI